jgi:hypothetical protein
MRVMRGDYGAKDEEGVQKRPESQGNQARRWRGRHYKKALHRLAVVENSYD